MPSNLARRVQIFSLQIWRAPHDGIERCDGLPVKLLLQCNSVDSQSEEVVGWREGLRRKPARDLGGVFGRHGFRSFTRPGVPCPADDLPARFGKMTDYISPLPWITSFFGI